MREVNEISQPPELTYKTDDIKSGEIWAIALSEDGTYLAGTTFDGRVNVWNTNTLVDREKGAAQKTQEYETKGSFGMSVDLVSHK